MIRADPTRWDGIAMPHKRPVARSIRPGRSPHRTRDQNGPV